MVKGEFRGCQGVLESGYGVFLWQTRLRLS
jgi:hypothetical protein